MLEKLKISFTEPNAVKGDVLVLMVGEDPCLGEFSSKVDKDGGGLITRAMVAASFKGTSGSFLELWGSPSLGVKKIILIGLGKSEELSSSDWLNVGKRASRCLRGKGIDRVVIASDGLAVADQIAVFTLGLRLGTYRFDKYKSQMGSEEKGSVLSVSEIFILTDQVEEAERLYRPFDGVADGVFFAQDLVNEPANVLGPEEFVERLGVLTDLGVSVEVLKEPDLRGLGMDALLGVARGSVCPPQLVIMRWNGSGESDETSVPVAFVGKGVTFDSGGISLKPSGGMEDMKGDMAGAAVVAGLMWSLASRKARVNAVGVVGLVENMPDGNAQRPGDIVKSMSGQTIEVINTDAEGRLVLADALWYTQDRFKPSFMIDIATLTGAIVIALGNEHAGLFSNNEHLAAQLVDAGHLTGEKLWALPLHPEYDKQVNSKFADMKNVGGREAGSITAAQFLQRHVNDTVWSHIDIAAVATLPSSKIDSGMGNATGFGVRLLNQWVSSNFE
ncbi:MAG: leucyl aminopeptidase [Alphaproteobacteria bacterium]|nr:leucyl aminopeptidase [Alphaproteobacteria bacterium]